MLDMIEVRRIAASYPPEARFVPVWERQEHLTEVQQLAWLLRFDPEAAAEVMSANATGDIASFCGLFVEAADYSHRGPHHG